MTWKTITTAAAVAVLGASLAVTPALAKNFCSPLKNNTKGCKNEIKACVLANCAGKTGKDKRTCKRSCKQNTVAACRLDNTVCTGSPSGAFID